jgi:hypothetical protein
VKLAHLPVNARAIEVIYPRVAEIPKAINLGFVFRPSAKQSTAIHGMKKLGSVKTQHRNISVRKQ